MFNVEETFQWSLLVLFVAIVIIGCSIWFFAPKEITYYYGSGDCAWAHWIWHTDEKAFCPQDKGTLPEAIFKLNETLKQTK